MDSFDGRIAVFKRGMMVTVVLAAVYAGAYIPFIATVWDNDPTADMEKIWVPSCPSKCEVNFSSSIADTFNSLTSRNPAQVHALFVHFISDVYTFQYTSDGDILDPLNLVWVHSEEAPFLSLDLGFNVYSFTTLSRVVHHMTSPVTVQPTYCLSGLSDICLIASLAKGFLGDVTKQSGVLCSAITYPASSPRVSYRCCKGNTRTQQLQCDIPVLRNSGMTAIFSTMVVTAGFAFFFFPALFGIVPNIEDSESLDSNYQVRNPLCQWIVCFAQWLVSPTGSYFANVAKRIVILLVLPFFYYVHLFVVWFVKTYEIPKMFNSSVNEKWVKSSKGPETTYIYIYITTALYISFYPVMDFSRLPVKSGMIYPVNHRKLKDWLTPFSLTKQYIKLIGSSHRKNLETLLGTILFGIMMSLAPVVLTFNLFGYFLFVSPVAQIVDAGVKRLYFSFMMLDVYLRDRRMFIDFIIVFGWVVSLCSIGVIFFVYVTVIFNLSLLILMRIVVYLWIGLAASKDYYIPRLSFLLPSVYYTWSCYSSVGLKYKKLLKQTYDKCKEQQEEQTDSPTAPCKVQALTYNDKGEPRISSKLLQNVIDEILPKSDAYLYMMVKIIIIVLFLQLTLDCVMEFGKSNDVNEFTKGIAFLLTALFPKLFEIFGEDEADQELRDENNACRIKKIVANFLSKSSRQEEMNNDPKRKRRRRRRRDSSKNKQSTIANIDMV